MLYTYGYLASQSRRIQRWDVEDAVPYGCVRVFGRQRWPERVQMGMLVYGRNLRVGRKPQGVGCIGRTWCRELFIR